MKDNHLFRAMWSYASEFHISIEEIEDRLSEDDLIEYIAELDLRREEEKKARLKAKNAASRKKTPRAKRRRRGR